MRSACAKPQLAQQMLTRALDAQVPAGGVSADEVYGGDARLRAFLEEHDLAYVLAVKATQPLWAHGEQGPAELPARELVAGLPALAWRRLSAGDGAKGPRVSDWARVELTRPGWPGRGFWLLAGRRLSDGELAFYACFGPARTTLAELVGVAGIRWAVEECFQTGKGQVGLDHYQVRRHDAWYRYDSLALVAQGFLAAVRPRRPSKRRGRLSAQNCLNLQARQARTWSGSRPRRRGGCWSPWCGGRRPRCARCRGGVAATRPAPAAATGTAANSAWLA